MSKTVFALPLLLAAALAWPHPSDAAVVYRSNEGWTVEGDPGSKLDTNAAEQMRKAERLEADGEEKAAYSAYAALVKRYPGSALAPKAQRKVGMLLEKDGQYDKAYEA